MSPVDRLRTTVRQRSAGPLASVTNGVTNGVIGAPPTDSERDVMSTPAPSPAGARLGPDDARAPDHARTAAAAPTPVSQTRAPRSIGDRLFAATAMGSGWLTVALVTLVAVFLVAKAIPAIRADKVNFLFARDWQVNGAQLRFGVLDMLYTTALSSVLAMLVAVPVAVGIALFITQYAPRRLAQPVGYLVDLLAAIPSIIYGIWGIYILGPHLTGIQHALNHLSVIPLFTDQGFATGNAFNAAVVLAIMILPIITAVSRDVFERTPREHIEAAWALGATRWEMIRLAVLPHGRAGVVSGAMLGLGRALGETIAVTLILSSVGQGNPFSFSMFNGGETFASKIANAAAEFNDPTKTGAYITAGLVLFVLTFIVNAAARAVVARDRSTS